MCGYCTEQIALLALQAGHPDSPADTKPLLLEVHLQEAGDLPGTLRQLSMANVTKPCVASVIMCRAIEALVVHGFESSAYQELHKLPQFVAAITVACANKSEVAQCDLDTRFKESEFAWLIEKDTYLVPEHFARQRNDLSDKTSTALLTNYIDWWLEGGSALRQQHHQRLNETEITNPIEDIPETERLLLKYRFPALWYSLLHISCLPSSVNILWAIVSKNPSGIPDFDGLDLWVQRRATLAYYDQRGIEPFLNQIQSVRPELFQYLAAARITKAEEKNALIAALESRGFDFSDPEEWQWADSQRA